MGMSLRQLEQAKAEQSQLETYETFKADFSDMEVVGIVVRRKGDLQSSSNIVLTRGSSGGGSITSFGFSQAFGEYLTKHLMGWIGDHIQDARKALMVLGVDADD